TRAKSKSCAPHPSMSGCNNSTRFWVGRTNSAGRKRLAKARTRCDGAGLFCERPTVAKKDKVVLPVAPLPDLVKGRRSQAARGIVIGGLGGAMLGRARVTRDVDAMVLLTEDRWADFLESGKPFGFIPRHTDTLAFAQEARVFLLRHQPTGIDVDLSIGCL